MVFLILVCLVSIATSPPPPPPPPMGWTGRSGNQFIATNHVFLLHLDPNKKPPAPLTSPTPKTTKVASPKQPAMPAFNPSDILKQSQLKKTKMSTGRSPSDSLPPPPPPPPQPTEPDWAPKEYLEKGKHYLGINVCTYSINLGICEIAILFIFERLIITVTSTYECVIILCFILSFSQHTDEHLLIFYLISATKNS